jgi:hypothetical protein
LLLLIELLLCELLLSGELDDELLLLFCEPTPALLDEDLFWLYVPEVLCFPPLVVSVIVPLWVDP